MKKRIITILLAVVMLISLMATAVLACEDDSSWKCEKCGWECKKDCSHEHKCDAFECDVDWKDFVIIPDVELKETGCECLPVIPTLHNVTLSYNANGGYGYMASENLPTANGGKAVFAVFVCAYAPPCGKIFAGWNTKADGTGIPVLPCTLFMITEDTTLYAQWIGCGCPEPVCPEEPEEEPTVPVTPLEPAILMGCYKTEYYQQQADGTYKLVETVCGKDRVCAEVKAVEKEYEGFVLNLEAKDTVASGKVGPWWKDELTLKLFYDIVKEEEPTQPEKKDEPTQPEKKEEEKPEPKPAEKPSTGDTSSYLVWAIVALAALSGIVVINFLPKKKEN